MPSGAVVWAEPQEVQVYRSGADPLTYPTESLQSLLEPATENLEEKYERFFQQSGLFVERRADEKQRYQAVSEERLKELAAKLGALGPLSEVIIAERDRT
jgi:hypothetical protein